MSEKRGRGRPRRSDADAEILGAARALLQERGYRDFNVDVIAERTGIAKTTIYRRWPTKGALLAALVVPSASANSSADAILAETASVVAALGNLDGDVVDVLRAIVEPRREMLIAAGVDADAADQQLGIIVMRALLAR